MKALIVALVALALVPAQAAAEGTPGRGAVQFDGTDAIVQVACGKEEGECRGQVSVAAVESPTAAVGGPAPYVVDAEATERVRVPLTDAGRQLLASVREVVVVVDAATAVTIVERIPSQEGIREGQTEVSPVARQRSCRSFAGVTEIRVRGVECRDASALIRSVNSRGRRCAKRCTVKDYSCTRRTSRVSCTSDTLSVRWRRVSRP